ncbi:MAG TPA: Rne/Rng family ribonuclease [Candidatus Eremiobacteraceae bacterium]|nr:Rne/Rng family ribonuclease [Candidatus Eremiobacteraceae bacterium]
MKTELLISCDDWENRVAVLEEGSLAEIYFEREEKVIGSIYKGRVENVLPGMGASFVNIGLGRNAFLYVDDVMRDPINIGETEITDRRKGHTVNELLHPGDEVLVQIVKEPRGLKGARVSTNISLPGRYLVLMPTGRYSGVSSKIEDEDERDRLKQIMRDVRPEGMATIVRTAARGVSKAELIADLGVQLRLWHGILESFKRATAPSLLHKDLNLVFKAVRDFMTSDVESVSIDSKEQFDEIRQTLSLLGPQYLNRLKLWDGPGNLFESRGIDDELQKLLKPKIMLPSGGHLVLEHTEALTVVDVNTGKFTSGRNLEDTLVRTNIEAAAEIARQVRLRDIGGIIVVDFIDMAHERSRQQVIDTLSDALRRDRTRSTIQVFSNLGLLEFTRKRVGKDLGGQLRSDCPYCTGLGTVMSSESIAIKLLRDIRQRARNGERMKRFDVVVDPSVATQLMGWYREEFEKLGTANEFELQVFVEPQRHRESVLIETSRRTRKPLVAGREIETELLAVRMPDPSSGVAVVDGNLIEVKDAANGVGQTVKLKITAADGNIATADLSEPLQSAQRRRRRGRGRGKSAVETEAPIAPPVVAHRDEDRDEDRERDVRREPERVAAAASRQSARSKARDIPYGLDLDEDEEEDYTLRGGRQAGGAVARATSSSEKPAAKREDRSRAGRGDARQRESVRGGRGGRAPERHDRDRDRSRPQPVIVGGEGDIDFEDSDDAVVVVPGGRAPRSTAAPRSRGTVRDGRDAGREREPVREAAAPRARTPLDEEDRDESDAPRRRRRRGGRGRTAAASPTEAGRVPYDDEESDVEIVDAGRPRTIEIEPERGRARSAERDDRPRARRDERDDRPRARGVRPPERAIDEDRSEASERGERAEGRPRHRFTGPIKQLYGEPVTVDRDEEDAPSSARPPQRDRSEPVRGASPRTAGGDRARHEAIPERRPLRDRDDRPRDRDDRPRDRDDRPRDDRPRVRDDRPRGSDDRPRDRDDRPPVRDDRPRERTAPPRDRGGRRPAPSFGRPIREPDVKPGDYADLDEPEDDLDLIIAPDKPATIEVEIQHGPIPRAPRGDAGHAALPKADELGERGPRRDRGDRPERGDRPRGRGRDGGDRGRRDAGPPRTGPAMKQLYPPADMEETPLPPGAAKPPPFDSRRTPRGPMMRGPGEPPPPKGKVRQLYPPPAEPTVESEPSHRHDAIEPLDVEHNHHIGAPEPNGTSIFVSDAEELEDRRRRARERAEERRRAEALEVVDPLPAAPLPWDAPGDDDF